VNKKRKRTHQKTKRNEEPKEMLLFESKVSKKKKTKFKSASKMLKISFKTLKERSSKNLEEMVPRCTSLKSSIEERAQKP